LRKIAITGIFLMKNSHYNDVIDFNAPLPTHAVRFLASFRMLDAFCEPFQ